MYQLAIFDMDGTILNTLEDLKISINHALIENGFPERTFEEVRRFVGNGDTEAGGAECSGKAQEKKSSRKYSQALMSTTRYTVQIIRSPIRELLKALQELKKRNIKTAVVSNKPDYGVQSLC